MNPQITGSNEFRKNEVAMNPQITDEFGSNESKNHG